MSLYFLSEMSVTDSHGGGLTFQRVLKDDLNYFDAFVYVSSFAKQYPPAARLEHKSVFEYSFLDPVFYQNAVTMRIRQFLGKSEFIKERAARRIIRRLAKKIQLAGSRWVVCPQAEISLRLVRILKEKHNARYVTWFMDDHLVRINHTGEAVYPGNSGGLMKFVLANSSYNWVISPVMQALYKKLFSAHSHILFGPALTQNVKVVVEREKQKSLRFIYFGAITSWQEDALVFFAKLLARIQGELHIYSSKDALPASLKKDQIIFKGALPPDKIISVAGEYDGIILPVSFKPEMAHLSNLNIATKMSECLAAGTITIAVGPPEAAMVQYLRLHDCAVIIDSQDENSEWAQLNKIYDLQLMEHLLSNAARLVTDHLTPDKMHANWQKGFAQLLA